MQEWKYMAKWALLTLSLIYLILGTSAFSFGYIQRGAQQVPAGTLLWKTTLPKLGPEGDSFSDPALSLDGNLYVNAHHLLFALTPEQGQIQWVVGPASSSGIAIGPDGTIYTAWSDGVLARHPDGSPKWVFPTLWLSSPGLLAIGADGTIYANSFGACNEDGCDTKLFAINPDGSQKWALRMFADAPAIGPDGTVYVAGSSVCTSQEKDCPPGQFLLRPRDTGLFALTPQGEVKWVVHLPNVNEFPSLAIGADGTIYVTLSDSRSAPAEFKGQLAAVTPTGTIKWIFNDSEFGAESGVSAPVIGMDGTIYFVAGGFSIGVLFAVTPTGQFKWIFFKEGIKDAICDPLSSTPAVGADGTIYIGTCDKRLVAINPDGSVRWQFQVSTEAPLNGSIGGMLLGNGVVYFISDQRHTISTDIVLYAVATDSPGLANSSWPMFQHDPQHTGRAQGP